MSPPPRLRRVAMNVSKLEPLVDFYVEVLGFTATPPSPDLDLARRLGALRARQARLRLGAAEIDLCELEPPAVGPAVPPNAPDLAFQHCALATSNIAPAFERVRAAGAVLITLGGGPVRLPAASGGARALKFRDPDGHPLELLELKDAAVPTLDHSALASRDEEASLAFYKTFGFDVGRRHLNQGPEQARLDGLPGSKVEVVGLEQPGGALRLELLAYRNPPPKGRGLCARHLLATRLVFEAWDRSSDPAGALELRRDPDGHLLDLPGPPLEPSGA